MNWWMIVLAFVAFLLSAPSHSAPLGYPDVKLTPGVTNAAITQSNINDNLCNPHWSTKTIRPTASYTDALKKEQLKRYAYADQNPSHYEEDHAISLELGGHPKDPKNLWPEPRYGQWSADKKDRLENYLHKQVCSGKMTLKEAQKEIHPNWVKYYQKYFKQ